MDLPRPVRRPVWLYCYGWSFAVKPVYEDAAVLQGAAPVKLNGKFCFIDKSGKRIGTLAIIDIATFRSKEK